MRRSRMLAFAGMLHIGSAVPLVAQSDTALVVRAGTRVRVDTDSGLWSNLGHLVRDAVIGRTVKGQTGTVVAFGPDTLVLRPDGGDLPLDVPLAAIHRLYISRGPGSRSRDATIGLVGGAAGGLLFALVMNQALGPEMPMDYGQSVAIFTAVGFTSGLLFGGQEQWRPVPLPGRMRLGAAGGSRLALSARVAF